MLVLLCDGVELTGDLDQSNHSSADHPRLLHSNTGSLSSHAQEHLPFTLGFPPVLAPFHRVHTRLQDSQPCPIVEGQVVAAVYFNCGGNWGLTRHYHEKPFIFTSAH